jgi:hypothetical protein
LFAVPGLVVGLGVHHLSAEYPMLKAMRGAVSALAFANTILPGWKFVMVSASWSLRSTHSALRAPSIPSGLVGTAHGSKHPPEIGSGQDEWENFLRR